MNHNADPIIAQATNGTPNTTNVAARNFHLVSQSGQPVSLQTLHGKTVALTFLDPVCVSQCPLIAQEFRQSDTMLGSLSRSVVMVAIVANPLYRARSYVDAFDQQEGLTHITNWLFLTGSYRARPLWDNFGVQISYEPGGSMVGHSEIAYVIDRDGHIRSVLETDPGPGTKASLSSFSVTLTDSIRTVAAES